MKTPRFVSSCRLYVIHRTLDPLPSSAPQLAEDVWEQHNAGLVQHSNTRHCSKRHQQSITRRDVDPDREESNREEMVKEDHRLPDDTSQ